MRVARWCFYLYFSVFAGLFLAGALTLFAVSSRGMPGGGTALWFVLSAFIAMALVFGQWEHFGERIRLIRWVGLCATATILGAAGLLLGLTSLD